MHSYNQLLLLLATILETLYLSNNWFILATKNNNDVLPRFLPHKHIYHIHIPKTGGLTFQGKLRALKFRFNSEEVCFLDRLASNGIKVVFLRSPRAHIYSQYLECKYSDWGKSRNKERYGWKEMKNEIENIHFWVDYFLKDWKPRHGDFNCYNPRNMETRYMTCRDSGNNILQEAHHHAKIEDRLNSSGLFEFAKVNLHRIDFVGITELYHESLCLFLFQAHGKLPDECDVNYEGVLVKDPGQQHQVPKHNEKNLPKEITKKFDNLTRIDGKLYLYGLEMFLHRLKKVENATHTQILKNSTYQNLRNKIEYLYL